MRHCPDRHAGAGQHPCRPAPVSRSDTWMTPMQTLAPPRAEHQTARPHVAPRETFRTSRLLDFANERELTAQIGHRPEQWPQVAVKELVDNSLDACEEAGVAPRIEVAIDHAGIRVVDNGPGIAADVVADILDFSVRVSSREAYVGPTRGAQGHALKTVLAMPFALDGEAAHVVIESQGTRH